MEAGIFQGDLDHCCELLALKWLDEVAERFAGFGLLEDLALRDSGEENHGSADGFPELERGLDAVGPAAEVDVHEDELGMLAEGHFKGLGAIGGHAAHSVAVALQATHDVSGDEFLVLDDQNAPLTHRALSVFEGRTTWHTASFQMKSDWKCAPSWRQSAWTISMPRPEGDSP